MRPRAIPLASADPGVVLGNPSQPREHHRDGVVCDSLLVGARRRRDRDTEFRGRDCVDRVDPDADTGDDLQVGAVAQDVGGEGIGADDRTRGVGAEREQLVG